MREITIDTNGFKGPYGNCYHQLYNPFTSLQTSNAVD